MAKHKGSKGNKGGSYSLYYSVTQKQQNELDQTMALQVTGGARFLGSYIFTDHRSTQRYEATEFVPDRSLFGVIRLRGRPTYKDGVLVASFIPADLLRQLPRVQL